MTLRIGRKFSLMKIIVIGETEYILFNRYIVRMSVNGYTDWYLPSKDELYLLFTFHANNPVVGGFSSGNYWSSSEVDSGNAWAVSLGNGVQSSTVKDYGLPVRAVRAF